jgi:hypothetical protein
LRHRQRPHKPPTARPGKVATQCSHREDEPAQLGDLGLRRHCIATSGARVELHVTAIEARSRCTRQALQHSQDGAPQLPGRSRASCAWIRSMLRLNNRVAGAHLVGLPRRHLVFVRHMIGMQRIASDLKVQGNSLRARNLTETIHGTDNWSIGPIISASMSGSGEIANALYFRNNLSVPREYVEVQEVIGPIATRHLIRM